VMIDLRLMGRAMTHVPVSQVVARLMPWSQFGFLVMVVTGVLLPEEHAADRVRDERHARRPGDRRSHGSPAEDHGRNGCGEQGSVRRHHGARRSGIVPDPPAEPATEPGRPPDQFPEGAATGKPCP